MYLRILKKDLKRKKTMNVILLIFIILAATFIASSANNMVSIMSALDNYFEKAGVPDYWFAATDKEVVDEFKSFADGQYDYRCANLMQIDPKDVKRENQSIDYNQILNISSLKNATKIFDKNDNEITKINDGEIYVTAELFYSNQYGFHEGDKITITANGKTKEFVLKGCTKDVLFSSPMIGMTRLLLSDNDFAYFLSENSKMIYTVSIYTEDGQYKEAFNNLELNTIFDTDKKTVKSMYIMDMFIAAVMLIVSSCLILISMVILRFTIHFTMSEEFREIGVMKAIGIPNRKIRGLYMVKYLAISIVGAAIGLVLSVPFGRLMIKDFSRNIVMSNGKLYFLNIICAFLIAAVVVLFCYFCTRKIKKFSPIDAIRNGENGERYARKGLIRLGKTKLSPVMFMAVNDIFSGLRRFVVMILIFVLGLLLIIIPINTINTLQSDNLIRWFCMADCNHVIGKELLFHADKDNRLIMDEEINNVRQTLLEHNIEAEVFEEAMFRMSISYNGKKTSSIALQGRGDITADQYTYMKGTAPQNNDEVAITQVVAEDIGAEIGDTVEIKNGQETKKYIVTALFQSMNNMGEGIRFYQEEQLNYSYVAGCFGIQIKYKDFPDKGELNKRKELLKELYPDNKVYTPGDYIGHMIGNIAGQLKEIKLLILLVVLSINILVTVLMVKSFIMKEKGEIAMLKAVGFKNASLIAWQTVRIGIVLLISIVIGTLLSTPLSKMSVGPAFKMMGAQSIEFDVRPLEVYVLYPLIVLLVTVFASMLAALHIRKISASETSNIE